jgi:hypothetical protein
LPDKESTAEEWEAETPGERAALEREWEELPDSDEETKVVLLPVNPYLVHVYWGIAPHDLDKLERVFRRPGPRAQAVLRFYDITQANFDATNAPSQFDVEIDLQAGNWYVHLENPAKSYCIDLGLRTAGGRFHRLAKSNVAETPRAWPSDKVDESYLLVEGDYSRVEKVAVAVEGGDAMKAPPEALEVGEPASTEENKTGPPEGGISRPVAAAVSLGEVTPVVKAATGTGHAGPQQGGEEKGPEAKELRRFRKVAPGEIERKVAELFRPQEWEWPGLTSQASGAGEPRPSGKERADLTLLSEESFRTGISSGGKSSVVSSQSSVKAVTED